MTPHIAAKLEDIAKTVVLFGDPTQTHHLAHKYLKNVRKVNDVRFACFFTGEHNGKTYTFGTSGMGFASAGIYIHELYEVYKVENIIRVGSCGSRRADLNLYDIVIIKESMSENTILAKIYHNGNKTPLLSASQDIHNKLVVSAKELGIRAPETRAHTTDFFYGLRNSEKFKEFKNQVNAEVVEMEAYCLFFYANLLNKKAACLATVVNTMPPESKWLTLQEQIDMRCPSVEIILNANI